MLTMMLQAFWAVLRFSATLLILLNFNIAAVANAATPEESVAQSMDQNADPCQDFYRYACGGWNDNAAAPNSETVQARNFSLANDDLNNRLHILMQEAASHYPSGLAEQDQIGAFYLSCLDTTAIEKQDLNAIQPYLALIAQVNSREGFLQVAGQLQTLGVSRLFTPDIIPSFANAQYYTLLLKPGDPGFPDGDIDTRTDRCHFQKPTALLEIPLIWED
ncbi:MAG: hypothetical protein ABL925_12235 [Methylococcales bacterium]